MTLTASIPDQKVRAALRVALETIAGIPARAYEGEPYTPVQGTPYLRERFAPQTSPLKSLGPNALRRHEGVWFLDVFRPTNEGTKPGDDLIDAIRSVFYPGAQFTLSGQVVQVRDCDRAGLQPSPPDFVFTPLAVTWRADALNLA